MQYCERQLEKKLIKGFKLFPCVYINGARQVGKTTFIKRIAEKYFNAEYVTFDNTFALNNAKESPMDFLNKFKGSIVLDEIQMVPELFRFLKMRIDEFREKGLDKKNKIILTGSTNIMTIPKLADALVGRMGIFTLYPFSCAEITGNDKNFVEHIFSARLTSRQVKTKISVDQMIMKTTFPELSLMKNATIDEIRDWSGNYIRTLLERDVRQISDIRKLDGFPRLLQALAGRVGGLLNDANIARSLGLDNMTMKRYRILMEMVFLICRIPPWFNNINKRAIKSPKIFFTDTLLLLALLNTNIYDLKERNQNLYGHIIENFICMELMKQCSYLSGFYKNNLYHYRVNNEEVDFVIEKSLDEIIGIEVKAKSCLDFHQDTKGLKALKETAGKSFKKGIIFYLGDRIESLGEDIWALPINILWEKKS